jgi:hypothetical protein
MKKLMLAALVSISILPGCGKKNDATTETVATGSTVVAAGAGLTGVPGTSGCAPLSYNTAITITYYGQIYGVSGLQANLQAHSVGSYSAGYAGTYTRSNIAGDTVNVYVSGQSAYAVVTLAANTVNAMIAGSGGYYGGTAQTCGFYINANIVQQNNYGGFSGNISGTIAPLNQSGGYFRYSNGTPILL